MTDYVRTYMLTCTSLRGGRGVPGPESGVRGACKAVGREFLYGAGSSPVASVRLHWRGLALAAFLKGKAPPPAAGGSFRESVLRERRVGGVI